MSREIVCDQLNKVFSNGTRALCDVDLKVSTTGIFSLIGRNGAGKTTLTRILATLLEPSSGSASIDGLDVMDDAKELRERMAVVPQEGRAIHWLTPMQSISSYLMWRGHDYQESRRRSEEALERFGLSEYANMQNRNLSGGMKRKVLVAMVTASDCDLIFLDEPTTGLDPISRRELWNILIKMSKDRFLFLTTHYLEEAEQTADSIGLLNHGRVLCMGSMAELRQNVKYRYSMTLPKGTTVPINIDCEMIDRRDGSIQLMTTEAEALNISKHLIENKVHFSMNPITLDDIFSRVVGGNDYVVGDDGA